MALTATATRSTYDCILHCLSMKDVAVIAFPPNRSNIQYSVQTMTTIEDFSATMSSQLMKEGTDIVKTAVVCRKYLDCLMLYLRLKRKLGK